MSWHIWTILGACGVGLLAALVAVFRKPAGLRSDQQQKILESHTEAQAKVNQAEAEAQTERQQHAKEAQTDLRALAAREAQQREAIENADTEEQIISESNKARRNWGDLKDTLQSPWLVGLLVLLFLFSSLAPAHAATKQELLIKIKSLSQDLNDCANHIRKQSILHKQKIKDKDTDTKRRLKQKDAALVQCRKESLVYRGKAPGNTALIVTVSVVSTLFVLSTVVAITAIALPQLYGNKRGDS